MTEGGLRENEREGGRGGEGVTFLLSGKTSKGWDILVFVGDECDGLPRE